MASILMGLIASWAYKFFGQGLRENLALILAIGVGVLVYAVLIYLMKVPEVERTLKTLERKVQQRRTATKEERE